MSWDDGNPVRLDRRTRSLRLAAAVLGFTALGLIVGGATGPAVTLLVLALLLSAVAS